MNTFLTKEAILKMLDSYEQYTLKSKPTDKNNNLLTIRRSLNTIQNAINLMATECEIHGQDDVSDQLKSSMKIINGIVGTAIDKEYSKNNPYLFVTPTTRNDEEILEEYKRILNSTIPPTLNIPIITNDYLEKLNLGLKQFSSSINKAAASISDATKAAFSGVIPDLKIQGHERRKYTREVKSYRGINRNKISKS